MGLATISVVGAALLFSMENVRHGPMDFIERHLGFSPDGGDGSMEVLFVVALVAIVVIGLLTGKLMIVEPFEKDFLKGETSQEFDSSIPEEFDDEESEK